MCQILLDIWKIILFKVMEVLNMASQEASGDGSCLARNNMENLLGMSSMSG